MEGRKLKIDCLVEQAKIIGEMQYLNTLESPKTIKESYVRLANYCRLANDFKKLELKKRGIDLSPTFDRGGILTDSIEASVSGNECILPTRTDFILPT